MTDILDNIEHAEGCNVNGRTVGDYDCTCWRAAIVEHVRELELELERERDETQILTAKREMALRLTRDSRNKHREDAQRAEAKLASAREALQEIADRERLGSAAKRTAESALADDAPTNPLDPMIEYMASNGVDEPDEWAGIDAKMALRAARAVCEYAIDDDWIKDLTPARIRELAGGDDGL